MRLALRRRTAIENECDTCHGQVIEEVNECGGATAKMLSRACGGVETRCVTLRLYTSHRMPAASLLKKRVREAPVLGATADR